MPKVRRMMTDEPVHEHDELLQRDLPDKIPAVSAEIVVSDRDSANALGLGLDDIDNNPLTVRANATFSWTRDP